MCSHAEAALIRQGTPVQLRVSAMRLAAFTEEPNSLNRVWAEISQRVMFYFASWDEMIV